MSKRTLKSTLKKQLFVRKLLAASIAITLGTFQYSAINTVYAQQDEHGHEHIQDNMRKDDHEDHNESAHKEADNHDEHEHGTEHKPEKPQDEHEHMEKDEHDHEEGHNDEHSEESGKADEHGHGHGHGGEEEEEGFVKMSAQQQAMAGIQVEPVVYESQVNEIITAPGEVVSDLYKTTLLTTQVDSRVLNRKVVLGQHVKKGDVLAVLYSLEIATAQNQLKVALSEWNRVRNLGKQTVGAKRYVEAKADVETNKDVLLAYGFNQELITQFINGKNKYPSGAYPVIAPHDGVIMEDNFQSGQYLPAGSTIARLVDESDVWVDALLAPEIGQSIPVGTHAKVEIDNKIFPATVIHDSHAIDEVTRTRKIRLIINNKDHVLHAGLFAKVFLELPVKGKVMLLPETALMRSSDGDWAVFIEQESGVFKQQEVELVNTINGKHQIQGLKPGQKVAVKGAFFLASEMAKGGFDPHNH